MDHMLVHILYDTSSEMKNLWFCGCEIKLWLWKVSTDFEKSLKTYICIHEMPYLQVIAVLWKAWSFWNLNGLIYWIEVNSIIWNTEALTWQLLFVIALKNRETRNVIESYWIQQSKDFCMNTLIVWNVKGSYRIQFRYNWNETTQYLIFQA